MQLQSTRTRLCLEALRQPPYMGGPLAVLLNAEEAWPTSNQSRMEQTWCDRAIVGILLVVVVIDGETGLIESRSNLMHVRIT